MSLNYASYSFQMKRKHKENFILKQVRMFSVNKVQTQFLWYILKTQGDKSFSLKGHDMKTSGCWDKELGGARQPSREGRVASWRPDWECTHQVCQGVMNQLLPHFLCFLLCLQGCQTLLIVFSMLLLSANI